MGIQKIVHMLCYIYDLKTPDDDTIGLCDHIRIGKKKIVFTVEIQ